MISHAVTLLALRDRLLTVSGLPTLQAFANVDEFTPTGGVPYIADAFIPATNVVETIAPSGIARLTGLYRVYWYGTAGVGLAAINAGVDAVLAKFAGRTAITLSTGDTLRIRGNPAPWAGEAVPDGKGWCVAVITIPWELRTMNVIAA